MELSSAIDAYLAPAPKKVDYVAVSGFESGGAQRIKVWPKVVKGGKWYNPGDYAFRGLLHSKHYYVGQVQPMLTQPKKVGDKIHVIRRNPRFKARPGTTESLAVKMAYSDSILYSLPILTQTPTGGSLVDFTRVFLSDDESIGRAIGPGFAFAYDRSTFAKVKSFPTNVEIEVAAVYSGFSPLETVADSRGVQVHVHYSISPLDSSSGYRPRKADDRVGYFLTASKDFSDILDDQQLQRYGQDVGSRGPRRLASRRGAA